MKHFSWLNNKGTTETCCDMGLCMTKDQDERIRLLQKIANDKDKEEKIEELEEGNEDEIKEEEKKKKLESYKAELRGLDDDELDKVLESLRAELHELKKKLNPERDEEKQERDSKLEQVGVDSSLITNTRYHVLTLDQSYRDSKSGDKLLISMGSSDSDTVTDASGDKLLKSLGSVD